ncbi:MAG: hypothetical protein K6348_06025, partial [Deferribacterales bacterium]
MTGPIYFLTHRNLSPLRDRWQLSIKGRNYLEVASLKEFFKRYTSAIVSLSGGIDSAYTLYLASHYIGANNILAVTVCNEHIFSYEIDL